MNTTSAEGMPTSPGWYWHRQGGNDMPVRVDVRPGHSYLAVESVNEFTGKREFTAVSRMGGTWLGQVQAPGAASPAEGRMGEVAGYVGSHVAEALRRGCNVTTTITTHVAMLDDAPIYLSPASPADSPATLGEYQAGVLADEFQSWLDFQERQYAAESVQVADDTHLVSPPMWPTRGTIKNWIALLRTLAKKPEGRAVAWLCVSSDGSLSDAVVTEHARDTYARMGRTITPLGPITTPAAEQGEGA